MDHSFMETMINRRTIYSIGSGSVVSEERILEIIRAAVKHVPSAFNSQSARVAVLFGEYHRKLWEIVMAALRKRVVPEKFAPVEQRIRGFAAGAGTILYFDDTAVTGKFAADLPAYRESFTGWADHANGMLQFAIWSLLEADGLGVNLQHYNPLIDSEVRAEFGFPEQWRLIAQMPFGEPTGAPGEKSFVDIDERVRVFGGLSQHREKTIANC